MLTLDRQRMRELDRRAIADFGLPGIALMENAGRGVADFVRQLSVAGPIVICCGRGNNGGDGYVIARHLDAAGHAVRVLVWGGVPSGDGDAAVNYRVIERSGLFIRLMSDALGAAGELSVAGLIVDALLGTGAQGEPRAPLGEVIDAMNAATAPTVAVDLPSGLDCDTGVPAGHTIRALHTCTLVAAKPGLLRPSAQPFVGQLHVLPIGMPRALLAAVAAGN